MALLDLQGMEAPQGRGGSHGGGKSGGSKGCGNISGLSVALC